MVMLDLIKSYKEKNENIISKISQIYMYKSCIFKNSVYLFWDSSMSINLGSSFVSSTYRKSKSMNNIKSCIFI